MCTRAMRSEKDAGRGCVARAPPSVFTSHSGGSASENGQLWLPTRRGVSVAGPGSLPCGAGSVALHSVSDTCTKFRTSVTEEVIWPTT